MRQEGIVANRAYINKNNESRTLGLSTQTPFFFASIHPQTEIGLGATLCTLTGEKLIFKRLHSTDLGPAGIVGGQCDVYEARREDGSMYRKLVVNDCCDQTTSTAPIGFSFSSSFPILSAPITQRIPIGTSKIFCRKCGEVLLDDSLFCHRCGEQVILPNAIPDPSPGISSKAQSNHRGNVKKGSSSQSNKTHISTENAKPITSTKSINPNKKAHGMVWYGFLVHFALIAGAILNAVYGFGYLTGSVYSSTISGQVTAEEVYIHYGSALQTTDIIYGFFLIGFAILAFILRYKLKNYKKDALKFIFVFYSISVVIPLMYSITVTLITSESFATNAVSSLIISLFFLFFNTRYFKKRSYLFIR